MRRSRASSDFLHHSEAVAYTPVRRPHTHDVVGDGLAIPQHVASLQVSATASSGSGRRVHRLPVRGPSDGCPELELRGLERREMPTLSSKAWRALAQTDARA